MAAMNFSLRPLEFSTSTTAVNHRKPATFLRRKPSISISFATTSPETTATSPVEKPAIELEFIGPKPGADGKPLVDRAKAISGEKLLRNIMLDNKIELYAAYRKVGLNRLRSLPNVGILKAPKKGSIQYIHNVLHRAFLSPEGLDGKVMNCGGGGSCGTCIVEIIDGKDLLNERTNTELRYLKKKPESWRLACQTIVGNKENSGKVVVQRLPQWRK